MNSHYQHMTPHWEKVRDCYRGAIAVKEGPRAMFYLPPSQAEYDEGLSSVPKYRSDAPDAIPRWNRYHFRQTYAQYDNFFKPVVDMIVGMMQQSPPTIDFGEREGVEPPPEVASLNQYGNEQNDTLLGLKQRLNHHQVLYGRYGLLLDLKTDTEGREPKFSISEYPAWKILDGDILEGETGKGSVAWVLLDETTQIFDPKTKEWSKASKYRVLGLDRSFGSAPVFYHAKLDGNDPQAQWAGFNLDAPMLSDGVELDKITYVVLNGQTLDFIPFTVCNGTNLGIHEWQDPPLYDLCEMALTGYQVDSLYKISLFNHASPTTILENVSVPKGERPRFHMGGVMAYTQNGQYPIKISLIETTGAGLNEMRSAKVDSRTSLVYTSPRDMTDGAGANASGEALKMRLSSGTAHIAAMDKNGARAIEEQMIFAQIWAGATSEEAAERTQFSAHTGYTDNELDLQKAVAFLMANKTAGANGGAFLSDKNAYAVLQRALPGVISTYDENEEQKSQEML